MGRISMPQLPPLNPSFREKSKTIFERSKAIQTLTSFLLNSSNCIVITGAGLSVDSGIRAYRGKDGSYSINKTYRPIFFHEFQQSESFRKRYWARSYLGYPSVRDAEPNIGHYALSALMKMGYVKKIITQMMKAF